MNVIDALQSVVSKGCFYRLFLKVVSKGRDSYIQTNNTTGRSGIRLSVEVIVNGIKINESS